MKFIFLFFVLAIALSVKSQCLTPVNFQTLSVLAALPNPSSQHDLTARRDTDIAKPFLYVAAYEKGVTIYNISNISTPVVAASIPTTALNNLYVSSLTQDGNYLYLALGDNFSPTVQASALGIVDITSPTSPTVVSVTSFSLPSGSGHVAIQGNYAFLSAMQNGILVYDITSKSSPSLVSQFIPDINYPKNNPTNNERLKINARSIVLKNNTAYLAYDAGGVRTINTANKSSLLEMGKYSNPVLANKVRAYNNLVLNDSLVYVACDYAGMEVLNIKNPNSISQVSWWNPWAAGTHTNNVSEWINSPGHCNEIEYDASCKILFMSAGRTDVIAVSVANPLIPDSCSQFGIKTDNNGTWGVGRYQNQIYACYLVTPVPFVSNWSGIKILSYNNNCTTAISEQEKINDIISVFPNPNSSSEKTAIKSDAENILSIRIKNVLGEEIRVISNINSWEYDLDVSSLDNGIYFLTIAAGTKTLTKRLVKN